MILKQLIKILKEDLQYEFKNVDLINEAITHRSFNGRNNERLEFLGDGILNFIIAEQLFQLFPTLKEGELSRLRSNLVKEETLATLARQLNLSQSIRLGIGEAKSGGALRDSILADALEAIIAAIYLDSSFEICRERVLAWYKPLLKKVNPKKPMKDPKSALQELLQAEKFSLPEYNIVRTKGEAHQQTFWVSCTVAEISYTSEGQGQSRRKAEQAAAQNFLTYLLKKRK